jgi:hypothetical protein
VGKMANTFKALYLYGNCERRCGGHKCEGHAHYPGRSVALPQATDTVKCQDGVTEVSRSRSRLVTANSRAEHRLSIAACFFDDATNHSKR